MFYEIFAVFVAVPWLAIIPAAILYWVFSRFRFRVALYASLLWLAYMIYELAIWFKILCEEDCNIRVDLLVIYPVLAVISLLVLVRVFMSIAKGRGAGPEAQ